MIKQAPSPGRLAAMAVFALSCFGILLFLWSSFGGPIPLAAQGYRYKVDFSEATQLTTNADVRISGVNVGRVTDIKPNGTTARATIEIDSRYAPIPVNSKAIAANVVGSVGSTPKSILVISLVRPKAPIRPMTTPIRVSVIP